MLSAEGGLGRTSAAGAFLSLSEPAVSSAWRVTVLTTGCAPAAGGCASFHLQLEQPVRIERGAFSATLADAPASYGDPLTFSRRSFSAAPSGRELDLRLGADLTWGEAGQMQLQLVGMRQPNNIAEAPLGLGVAANWRARF